MNMKAGLTLTQLAQEIERQAESKRDFIAPASELRVTSEQRVIADDAGEEDRVITVPVLHVGGNQFPLNKVGHEQLAEYTGIPKAYYDRMLADEPALLATNANRWLAEKAREKDQRMVRTLDGKARALLSSKYRALDNVELAEAILPVLLQQNLMIMSSQITERRLYIKAVDRKILLDVPTGRALGDGSHVFFDTVSPAITISNSEVGGGALSIETGVYTKVCTNLAMIGTGIRKFHTGSRSELSPEVMELLSDETKRATDAAVWGQVRDIITGAFDLARFKEVTKKLEEATTDRIQADVPKVIEVVGKKFGFNEGEKKGILQRLIEGGDLTRYGLHSAITRNAEDVPDYDRASEMERFGGRVIELPRNQWQEILKQAA
jgi:hypothetical protein